MAENKFIKTGIGVGVSFYDKNANDVPLIEAHKVLISGEVDENGQLNIDIDTQVRLDDKIIELENKINEAADAVNEETVKDIIKNNLNIENGSLEYGANNLQQKPEVKNGVTTTSWTSQNEQVQNWTGTNGQDNSVINRDGNTIYVGAFATENGGNVAVFGGKSQASGGKSFAAGSKNIALGNNSAAFGNENFAAGQHSFTTGQQNAALGNASWAAGALTVAKNTNDMTIGYKTIANGHKPEDGSNNEYHPNYRQSFPQFVIGRLNEEDNDFSKEYSKDGNGLDILSKKAFIIGGGIEEWNGDTATYNRKNVASIDYNGNGWFAGDITCTDANSGITISLASQAFINSMGITDLESRVSTLESQNGTIASDSITLKNAAGVTWKVSVDDNGDLIAEKL